MRKIKINISNNEIIYKVKTRGIFKSSIRKAIKRKNENDPDEKYIKEVYK